MKNATTMEMTMNRPKKKRKKVPIYDPADILAGKKNPKKIGEMSDPDEPGPVIVDYETLVRLVEGGKHSRVWRSLSDDQIGRRD